MNQPAQAHACDFPRFFEIQTASYCNAQCVICPHRETAREFPQGVMSDALLESILRQIGERSHWGIRIIPYLNNEPFLDDKFIPRLKLINQLCPEAEVEVSTNLSRLDERARRGLAGCDLKELRMSVFGFSKQTHQRAMPGLDWQTVKRNLDGVAGDKRLRAHIGQLSLVMISYPGLTEADVKRARKYCANRFIKFEYWGFLDRSGNVAAFKNDLPAERAGGCEQNRPLERMHILYDGKVALCCMDWRRQHILGDLTRQSIAAVWRSPAYTRIRKQIYSAPDTKELLCNKCKLAL